MNNEPSLLIEFKEEDMTGDGKLTIAFQCSSLRELLQEPGCHYALHDF